MNKGKPTPTRSLSLVRWRNCLADSFTACWTNPDSTARERTAGAASHIPHLAHRTRHGPRTAWRTIQVTIVVPGD